MRQKNLLALHNLTEKNLLGRQRTPNFSPRPPRGGRRTGQRPSAWRLSYFNPRPPRGGRHRQRQHQQHSVYFNPRPPRGGRLFRGHRLAVRQAEGHRISIHALREGGDTLGSGFSGRTSTISIHALREGGDWVQVDPPGHLKISIHALREGGDCLRLPHHAGRCYFNPRPPRGGRPSPPDPGRTTAKFQSTPSARGATRTRRGYCRLRRDISIHALREGGDVDKLELRLALFISIHALREGGDRGGHAAAPQQRISIHALREGGDTMSPSSVVISSKFQSTPSARGATLPIFSILDFAGSFQSTPSARGATRSSGRHVRPPAISIHALREGGDGKDAQFYLWIFDK